MPWPMPLLARRARPLLLVLLALLLGSTAGCATDPDARPRDLPTGINDVFLSKDLDVDAFVERFEGESRAVYARRHAIVDALDLAPGDRVADVGAGTGFFAFLFAERVGGAGRVDAVEISPRFLEHLRDRAAELDLENVRVVEATERDVGLAPDSIDLAFLCDVYHHFEYPQRSLESLHRAIRPGGALVLIEFHRIPGVTSDFLLEHVRAGQEVFTEEIESAGFVLDRELVLDGLDDNYVLRFLRTE